MADLLLHFEFEPGADLEAAASELRERLAALDTVEAVDARPEDARITGLEIAGAIAVGIQIVHGSTKILAEMRRLIVELKRLHGEVKGLRTIAVDVKTKPVKIDQVTDDDLTHLSTKKRRKR